MAAKVDGRRFRPSKYLRLPLQVIGDAYRNGASWHALAQEYEVDHKRLKRFVLQANPNLKPRTHAESQRLRREKEYRRRQEEKRLQQQLNRRLKAIKF